jgi:hypothetical protein
MHESPRQRRRGLRNGSVGLQRVPWTHICDRDHLGKLGVKFPLPPDRSLVRAAHGHEPPLAHSLLPHPLIVGSRCYRVRWVMMQGTTRIKVRGNLPAWLRGAARSRGGEPWPNAALRAPAASGVFLRQENKNRPSPVDHRSLRDQLAFSIGFAVTRSRGLLRRILAEHAPDDARQQLAARVVEHLEPSGFEIDEAEQVLRKRPPSARHD